MPLRSHLVERVRTDARPAGRPGRRAALVVALATVLVVVGSPGPGARGATAAPSPDAPGAEVDYRPPVDAPVIDPFRPPPHPYGAGNRGLSYGVAPLTPIRAAAAGEVVFAGPVAGSLHVTIRHADGLRTSYSFLASIAVAGGTTVAAGAILGWSTEVFHFGVRTPDGTYLDPELLWRVGWEPRLVPGGDDGVTTPTERVALADLVRERTAPLASWLATGRAAAVDGVGDLRRRLDLWVHLASELRPATHARRLVAGFERWRREHADCTATDQPVPPPPERRIVVEVGGIGSTSDDAAIARLDTGALGYDPADVVRFSYAGGRVPPTSASDRATGSAVVDGRDPFAHITTTEYGAVDSQGDLVASGRRLARLLDELAVAAPGVPIDIVAHSQGGVVARLALEDADRTGRLPAAVQNLVTLGSPHQGADLATAVEAVRGDPTGAAVLDRARTTLGVELDPALPAAGQLSEVSPVIGHLRGRPAPPGIRFTSIAARGDLVVPVGRTEAPGARRATVSISGVPAHDRLPGSPEATRAVLLAVAGRAPQCRSLSDTLLDVVVGDSVGLLEDSLGATAAGAAVAVPG